MENITPFDSSRSITKSVRKVCKKCREEKDIEEFGKRNASPDGRETQCLECHRKRQAIYRAERRPDYLF